MVAFPVLCRGAGPLGPYLLRSGDVPELCLPTSEFYPINPKIELFYQYKVYRSTVPPAVERYAQSFDCDGKKGTVYFFAYATADQARAAERFAKPLLTRDSPAPLFRQWPHGFVVVSFKDPPRELLTALDTRLSGRSAQVSEAPGALNSNATIPAPTFAPPPLSASLPTAMPSAQTAQAPSAPVSDILDVVIDYLMQKVPCREGGPSKEAKTVCDLMRAFQGGGIFGGVIGPDQPLVGAIYSVDQGGRVGAPVYLAAIGSGRPLEISLMPLYSDTGSEDYESQALLEARRDHKPWPKNEIAERIAKHPRPEQATAIPTEGRSLVIRMRDKRSLFIRQTDQGWILIGVSGDTPEEQMQSASSVGVLY